MSIKSRSAAKRFFLGRPLPTAKLSHERLGKPTALAVFASDNLSSSAYATEEILRVLVPALGLAAFTYLLPVTGAVLLVLVILVFSYRQTIKAYPTAGGAYIVTKDNFGLVPAQLAGVALLTDYVLTVAVSVAAGVLALTSAVPSLYPFRVPIAVAFIAGLSWGNLRGVRESGRMFSAPTYFFIATMVLLVGTGVFRYLTGGISPMPSGSFPTEHGGVAEALSVFLILHAFASGGAAVTGVEAISNGVPAFKPPEWRNARTTLVWMASLLGTMFVGLSFLARQLHVAPDPEEKVSLVSQLAQLVFGGGPVGRGMFFAVQLGTMLILVLAANTSFADFPRLASFHAGDNFLPRQFTKRGHRLVFSNGIIGLAIAASALVIAFQASVTRLIPLYAIGVFTSFTLSQAGMARRHVRLKESGWRRGLVVNGTGAAATGLVTIIIGVTKFTHGAWAIVVAVPVLVFLLTRLNRQYEHEERELKHGIGAGAPRVRSHVAVVLVEEMDTKLYRAIEFSKTILPDEIKCVHVNTDSESTSALAEAWSSAGPDLPLEIVPGPSRRRAVAVAEFVRSVARADRAVTIVSPGPFRVAWWIRLRHGRTAFRTSRALSRIPNVNVIVVRDHPFHVPDTSHAPSGRVQIRPRPGHRALVLIDGIDRSVLRAISLAEATNPLNIRCVHIAIDPERANEMLDRWAELGIRQALEVVRCEDRNIGRAVASYMRRLHQGRVATTVFLPRRDYPHLWHRLLHDRTSRSIARALTENEDIYIVSVPWFVGSPTDTRSAARPAAVSPESNRRVRSLPNSRLRAVTLGRFQMTAQ